MRIGLTYDLRSTYLAEGWDPLDAAEFDDEDVIESLEGALRRGGHDVVRIGHFRELAAALLAGERWDLVFNIAESYGGFGREALVPALLEAYRIPCTFSDSLVCAVTLQKAAAKRWVRDAGLATADFAVIERLADVERVALPFPLFAKPIAEGSSKGVDADALVRDGAQLRAVCARLLARFAQPVLVERYLPGREVTVGVLGTGDAARAVGVLELELRAEADAAGYTYANKQDWRERMRYRLADDAFGRRAAELALAAHRTLGARDASRVDVRADEHGAPRFLEINPLPGLHPVTGDLPMLWRLGGRAYDDLIGEIVGSARARAAPRPEASLR